MRPLVQNAENQLPGTTFGHMCGQRLKMNKMRFQLLLLHIICVAKLSAVESGINSDVSKSPWLSERGFMDTGCGNKCLMTLGKRVRSYERFETISGGYIDYDYYFLHACLWRQS